MPRLTPEKRAARFEARLIRGAITTVRGHGELTRFIGFSGVRTPHILPKPNVLFDFVAPGPPPIIQNNQAGHLVAAFAAGQEASEQHPTFQWTHILFCRRAAIIGDLFPAAPAHDRLPVDATLSGRVQESDCGATGSVALLGAVSEAAKVLVADAQRKPDQER